MPKRKRASDMKLLEGALSVKTEESSSTASDIPEDISDMNTPLAKNEQSNNVVHTEYELPKADTDRTYPRVIATLSPDTYRRLKQLEVESKRKGQRFNRSAFIDDAIRKALGLES